MLIIRNEQLATLQHAFLDGFVSEAAEHLRSQFGSHPVVAALDHDALDGFVRAGLESAHRYGIVHRNDVRLYLECMALLGRDFDTGRQHPWAPEILTDRELTGTEKMSLVSDYLVFERVLD